MFMSNRKKLFGLMPLFAILLTNVGCNSSFEEKKYELDGAAIDIDGCTAIGVRTMSQINGVFSKNSKEFEKIAVETNDGTCKIASLLKDGKAISQNDINVWDFIDAGSYYYVYASSDGSFKDKSNYLQFYSCGNYTVTTSHSNDFNAPSLYILSKTDFTFYSFDKMCFDLLGTSLKKLSKYHIQNGIRIRQYNDSYFYLSFSSAYEDLDVNLNGLYSLNVTDSGLECKKIYGQNFMGIPSMVDIYGNTFISYNNEQFTFVTKDAKTIVANCPDYPYCNFNSPFAYSYENKYYCLNEDGEFVLQEANKTLSVNSFVEMSYGEKSLSCYYLGSEGNNKTFLLLGERAVYCYTFTEVNKFYSARELRFTLSDFDDYLIVGKDLYCLTDRKIEHYSFEKDKLDEIYIPLDDTYSVRELTIKDGYFYISGTKGFESFNFFMLDDFTLSSSVKPRTIEYGPALFSISVAP